VHFVPFPTGNSPNKWRVADWIELQALDRGTPFKRGDLKSAIAAEDINSPDVLEEDVWAEISVRARLMGQRWPLRLDGDLLMQKVRSPLPVRLYRYLCILSLDEVIDNTDRRRFEEILVPILEPLFGSCVMRIGAPRSEGQPSSFINRFKGYLDTARVPEDERGKDPFPTDQDLGLDVVGWQRMADGRGGDIHFWTQCATGLDWDGKLTDLDLAKWSPYHNLAVPPVRVFATPHVITFPPARWARACRSAGWILDRPRLAELAAAARIPRSTLGELGARFEELVGATG
jgi:hypothetical protein